MKQIKGADKHYLTSHTTTINILTDDQIDYAFMRKLHAAKDAFLRNLKKWALR